MNTNASKAANDTITSRRIAMVVVAVMMAAWASASASAAAPSTRDCAPTSKAGAATKTVKGDVRAALEDRAVAPMKRLTGDKSSGTMTA